MEAIDRGQDDSRQYALEMIEICLGRAARLHPLSLNENVTPFMTMLCGCSAGIIREMKALADYYVSDSDEDMSVTGSHSDVTMTSPSGSESDAAMTGSDGSAGSNPDEPMPDVLHLPQSEGSNDGWKLVTGKKNRK